MSFVTVKPDSLISGKWSVFVVTVDGGHVRLDLPSLSLPEVEVVAEQIRDALSTWPGWHNGPTCAHVYCDRPAVKDGVCADRHGAPDLDDGITPHHLLVDAHGYSPDDDEAPLDPHLFDPRCADCLRRPTGDVNDGGYHTCPACGCDRWMEGGAT